MGVNALERVKGIEPSSGAWKASALPLSYTRPGSKKGIIPLRNFSLLREIHLKIFAGGGGWIRTIVGVSQQIYSLPPLATRAPLRCERTELLPEVLRLSRRRKRKNFKLRVYTYFWTSGTAVSGPLPASDAPSRRLSSKRFPLYSVREAATCKRSPPRRSPCGAASPHCSSSSSSPP